MHEHIVAFVILHRLAPAIFAAFMLTQVAQRYNVDGHALPLTDCQTPRKMHPATSSQIAAQTRQATTMA
jgi:hypothetical protein